MEIISSIQGMQEWSRRMRRQGKTIGFVPTMGYLHQGHLSLMRRARAENDLLVVSIFVNPTQFAPGEDFKRYPRDFSRDKKMARLCGTDVIFFPRAKAMYRRDCKTYVDVEELSELLCGRSRPTHFRGVTTVVAKLFNIVQPDIAYLGQKDAQQAAIIKQMSQDLNFPLKIKILPIVRGQGGLALSSRNSYLDENQKKAAQILYKALQTAVGMIKSGHYAPREIIAKMRGMIQAKPGARIDYIEILEGKSLKKAKKLKGPLLIALAVYFGKTRLIDNALAKV